MRLNLGEEVRLRQDLWCVLRGRLLAGLRCSQLDSLADNLWDRLCTSLMVGLWDSVEVHLWRSFGESVQGEG